MSNEAFQLIFLRLVLTLPNLGENLASMVLWRRKFNKNLKKNKHMKLFEKNIFFLICYLIFITNYLVFHFWSQLFQSFTIKPLNLLDTNKEQQKIIGFDMFFLAGFWPSKTTVWLQFDPKLGQNMNFEYPKESIGGAKHQITFKIFSANCSSNGRLIE